MIRLCACAFRLTCWHSADVAEHRLRCHTRRFVGTRNSSPTEYFRPGLLVDPLADTIPSLHRHEKSPRPSNDRETSVDQTLQADLSFSPPSGVSLERGPTERPLHDPAAGDFPGRREATSLVQLASAAAENLERYERPEHGPAATGPLRSNDIRAARRPADDDGDAALQRHTKRQAIAVKPGVEAAHRIAATPAEQNPLVARGRLGPENLTVSHHGQCRSTGSGSYLSRVLNSECKPEAEKDEGEAADTAATSSIGEPLELMRTTGTPIEIRARAYTKHDFQDGSFRSEYDSDQGANRNYQPTVFVPTRTHFITVEGTEPGQHSPRPSNDGRSPSTGHSEGRTPGYDRSPDTSTSRRYSAHQNPIERPAALALASVRSPPAVWAAFEAQSRPPLMQDIRGQPAVQRVFTTGSAGTAPSTPRTPSLAQTRPAMRSAIACLRCRKSKIKCTNDGGTRPCDQCIKGGHECVYSGLAPPRVSRPANAAPSDGDAQALEKKRGVKRKAAVGDVAAPPPLGTVSPAAEAALYLSPARLSYIGQRYADDLVSAPYLTDDMWDKLCRIYRDNFFAELPFLHLAAFKERIAMRSQRESGHLTAAQHDFNCLLLAFLALTARFEPDLARYVSVAIAEQKASGQPHTATQGAATHKDAGCAASDFYAAALTRVLGSSLDAAVSRESIERVQTLLMMGLHAWMGVEPKKGGMAAWMYVGMAARMAQALGLNLGDRVDSAHSADMRVIIRRRAAAAAAAAAASSGTSTTAAANDAAITDCEVRRRTMFACFTMDRIVACGAGRVHAVRSCDLEIQLPCSEYSFDMSLERTTGFLPSSMDGTGLVGGDGGVDVHRGAGGGGDRRNRLTQAAIPRPIAESPESNVLARFLELMDLWGDVTRYSFAGGRFTEQHPPWDERTTFCRLRRRLAAFYASLPETFTLNTRNWQRHQFHGGASMFVSLHVLGNIAAIMLHREYVPFVPIRCAANGPEGPLDAPTFRPEDHPDMPPDFWRKSARELFAAARNIITALDICEHKRSLPQSAVVIYGTWVALFTGLYAAHFPYMDVDRVMQPPSNTAIAAPAPVAVATSALLPPQLPPPPPQPACTPSTTTREDDAQQQGSSSVSASTPGVASPIIKNDIGADTVSGDEQRRGHDKTDSRNRHDVPPIRSPSVPQMPPTPKPTATGQSEAPLAIKRTPTPVMSIRTVREQGPTAVAIRTLHALSRCWRMAPVYLAYFEDSHDFFSEVRRRYGGGDGDGGLLEEWKEQRSFLTSNGAILSGSATGNDAGDLGTTDYNASLSVSVSTPETAGDGRQRAPGSAHTRILEQNQNTHRDSPDLLLPPQSQQQPQAPSQQPHRSGGSRSRSPNVINQAIESMRAIAMTERQVRLGMGPGSGDLGGGGGGSALYHGHDHTPSAYSFPSSAGTAPESLPPYHLSTSGFQYHFPAPAPPRPCGDGSAASITLVGSPSPSEETANCGAVGFGSIEYGLDGGTAQGYFQGNPAVPGGSTMRIPRPGSTGIPGTQPHTGPSLELKHIESIRFQALPLDFADSGLGLGIGLGDASDGMGSMGGFGAFFGGGTEGEYHHYDFAHADLGMGTGAGGVAATAADGVPDMEMPDASPVPGYGNISAKPSVAEYHHDEHARLGEYHRHATSAGTVGP